MSTTGLRAPRTGLTRPTPKKGSTGLGKPGNVPKPASTPVRSASRSGLKYSASNSSTGGLTNSLSTSSLSGDIRVGCRVTTRDTNLPGTVRYCGEPQFAKGVWVGVELDDAQGKNDGEVKGVKYFTCPPNHGLFCKPDKLMLIKEKGSGLMRPVRTPSQTNVSKVNYEAKFNMNVGCKVLVNDAKTGTLLYLGLTEFAKGVWAGVALDTNDGKNDGSVKGKRYFTCDPGYGLFAQANKIKKLESPHSSTSSLSINLNDTPRKSDSEIMKPDFNNRTPVSTSGVSSSLSGILRSRSKDIENMQKNIGDLQQRLSEVNSTPVRSTNGPSIYNTQRSQETSDEYEKLKKLHEESEKERAELMEKVKNMENEKFTYEARIAEVAEGANQEKSSIQQQVDTLNKEIVVLNANHSSQTTKLENDIKRLEQELQTSLENISEYEANALQNDNSAELAMNREKLAELKEEVRLLRLAADADKQRASELEQELADKSGQSEQSDQNLRSKITSLEEVLSAREIALSESKMTLQSERDDNEIKLLELQAEKEDAIAKIDELMASQNRVTELEGEILEIRSTYETAISNNDNKVKELETEVSSRDSTISTLKQQLSDNNSAASTEKLHLEQKIQALESDMTHLQDQSIREKERISYLEKSLSSVENDTQLGDAHQKISELENVISTIEVEKLEELKSVNNTVMELQEQLTQEQHRADQDRATLNKKYTELQISLDNEQMKHSMVESERERQIGDLELQLAELDKLQSDYEQSQNMLNNMRTELQSVRTGQVESDKTAASSREQQKLQEEEHRNLVACLENNIDELETRIATVTNDKLAISESSAKRVKELEQEVETLKQNTATERDSAINELKEQLSSRTAELSSVTQNYDAKCAELATVSKSFDTKTAALEQQLLESTEEKAQQAAKLGELQEEAESSRQLYEQAQQQLAALREQNKELGELQSEKCALERELSDLKVRANRQSDEEIENLHKQINNLTDENDVLKTAFNDKNAVFDELSTEVSSLRELSETAFTELKKNEFQFNESVKALKVTQIQLDEALKRTKELQIKVNDLEEEVVRERARANELEQQVGPGMSFEDVDNLSNLSSSPPISAPSFVPNRVFCDNCDTFDEHDTDNCPISQSPGGIRHGGHRGLSNRPYCTVCEMFGHTADECEDDMTF